jgi:hypothetical protein
MFKSYDVEYTHANDQYPWSGRAINIERARRQRAQRNARVIMAVLIVFGIVACVALAVGGAAFIPAIGRFKMW